MKKINLITPLPPEKQYELQRWFLITIFLCLIFLITTGLLIIPSFLLCKKMKKEIALLQQKASAQATITAAKNTLQKEYDDLHVRATKLSMHTTQKKNPYEQIADIIAATGDGVQLESIRLNGNKSEIIIVCPTAEHAQVFIKRLSASPRFSRIKMISLQQDQGKKQLLCTISGNITF